MSSRTTFPLCFAFLCLSLSGNAQKATPAQDSRIVFTTTDLPGALTTVITGINTAGTMTGYYGVKAYGGVSFRVKSGRFTYFTYPGKYSTLAQGINDSELIVEYAFVGAVDVLGFTS